MKQILKNTIARREFILIYGFILNSVLWLYTAHYYFKATDIIPLHYTIYFGIDFIDFKTKLFNYPLIGLSIIIVNGLLALMCKQEKLIGYLLLSNAFIMQIFLIATVVSLIVHYY
jgi:hypothetical protein